MGGRAAFSSATVRLGLFLVALLLAWGGMALRLVHVQVVQAAELSEMGLSQRLVSEELAPQRGKIFDRQGDLLAMTVEAQTLYAVPGQVTEPLFVAQQVGGLLGADSDTLMDRLTSDKSFVYIKRQVDPKVAQVVMDLELDGVYTLPEASRVYPAGVSGSHVVGFVNIDGDGQEGLELSFDDLLRGEPGHAIFERDRRGRAIPQGRSEITPAVPGSDLVTTIDLPLQYEAQGSCNEALERTGGTECWVVVLAVETGEILAMTGAPGFDPATRQSADGSGFSNFIVRGIFEPGSTQKLITVSAALEEGVVSVDTLFEQVGDTLELREGACKRDDDDIHGCYRDFEEHEAADMTVSEIFTKSSNVGTISIAEKLGQARLIEYIEKFGLADPTGVEYNAEASGLLNFAAGCETCWASAAIGYSVAASPLQMAAAFAAVANDGMWVQPHLVASIVDSQGAMTLTEPESRRVLSVGTAMVMRDLLAGVVEGGTGRGAEVPGYRVGGKTGTANKLGEDGRYTTATRASFVGMAPIDDPKLVVAVIIDEPSHEFRTGGLAAAPTFAAVMEQALHRLGVTPDAADG